MNRQRVGLVSAVLLIAFILISSQLAGEEEPDLAVIGGDAVGAIGTLREDVVSAGASPPRRRTNRTSGKTTKSEFGKGFALALAEQDHLFPPHFGRWSSECDACENNCIHNVPEDERLQREDWKRPLKEWAASELDQLAADNLAVWNSTGITFDHHVSMVCCSYRTRMHYNPSGFWVHISGHNVTLLRLMVDGYDRYKRSLKLLRKVVANGPPFTKALVAYFSMTDTPCNPMLPYMTFFLRRGVKGILVPDDTFENNKGGWEAAWESLRAKAKAVPYSQRNHTLFFRGSPTHPYRSTLENEAKKCCPEFTNISLAVMERFKHLSVPLEEHVNYRFLAAVRGRTASNRDKYLSLLSSTIVRMEEEEPWFQFYHALWKPWVNYVPMNASNVSCLVKLIQNQSNLPFFEKIAARGAEVGDFLSEEVVENYMRSVLNRYANLQRYTVDPDPVEFTRRFYYFVKKRYANAQVMPDDRNPVKFIFYKWISRRIRQMLACREEAAAASAPSFSSTFINGSGVVGGSGSSSFMTPKPTPPAKIKCWY